MYNEISDVLSWTKNVKTFNQQSYLTLHSRNEHTWHIISLFSKSLIIQKLKQDSFQFFSKFKSFNDFSHV